MEFRRKPTARTTRPSDPIPREPDDAPDGMLAGGVPLGQIVPRRLVDGPEIVVKAGSHSVAAEKFRRLKTLLSEEDGGSVHVIVVTSAAPAEGKSLVALNLALAFAADRKGSTLLLDADLRRPAVERWLQPAPNFGFTELLSRQIPLEHSFVQLQDSHLWVLPAGHPASDPVELLASQQCGDAVKTLRERFDRIVIDTPPILPFTDANVIGKWSDGAILVARCGKTPTALYAQALDMITTTRILGTVLNDATYNLADREHYYDHYYHKYYHRESKK